jgi:hypothetical protein
MGVAVGVGEEVLVGGAVEVAVGSARLRGDWATAVPPSTDGGGSVCVGRGKPVGTRVGSGGGGMTAVSNPQLVSKNKPIKTPNQISPLFFIAQHCTKSQKNGKLTNLSVSV